MNSNKAIQYTIEKRPIAYYKVSVMSNRGHGRKAITVPVSVDPTHTGGRFDDVDEGEQIIACVPCAQKSFEVFILSDVIGTESGEISIGLEIDGIHHRAWEEVAEEELREWSK